MTHGVVIGKFYPPHQGHHHLIEAALSRVDELTVIVCEREGQALPGKLRAAWLQEQHPRARLLVVPDRLPEGDSRAWAEYTAEILGLRPQVVFTSEEYGDRYAAFLGARHVLVDLERRAVPISATAIRRNPLAHWEWLSPPVRAHFARRVCVLGAESTGTTTMARALAERYRTAWVPEFGRAYSEAKMACPDGAKWRTEEFALIASLQNQAEDALARVCNKILFCDTDAFATALWHERYLRTGSSAVEALAASRRPDLYLLTDADIRFVQDGTRDGEGIRHSMHRRFLEELQAMGKPFLVLSGPHGRRLADAAAACDRVLAEVRPLP